jgi:hypothetical protein
MKVLPATSVRWRILQRQMERLREMREVVLHDINRMELTLERGAWPASLTLGNIVSLRQGHTPILWR